MDERTALLRAVVAAPADDLPRLVFADWLEEHGEAGYAGFVRAQIELANTPPWEPFAVRCRHRDPDLLTGAPWWPALPRVDGHALEWHPEHAFRRGFAWGLIVRDMPALFAEAPRLFADAPVGQLHLRTATLDDWRRFAAQPWLPRVKSIHFYGTRTPIEPVRVLCDSPLAAGIEEIVFEASSRPGMPEVIRGLMRSPLGRRLRSLELRAGPDEPDELLDAIGDADPNPRLERLALVTMGAGAGGLGRLYQSPVLERLATLEVVNIPGADLPIDDGRLPALTRLRAAGCRRGAGQLTELSRSPGAIALRSLDLSENPLELDAGAPIFSDRLQGLSGLRSLGLRRTTLGSRWATELLTGPPVWPNLVELDLRDNRMTDVGVGPLLAALVPPDLTALLLDDRNLTSGTRAALREKFGDAVIFGDSA